MADNTFLAPLSPIQRSNPSDRLVLFQKNETSIYNKFNPYYQAGGGIGPDQPFVYTKLTDSTFSKNLTKYDSQALPAGSVARDLIRIGKFTVSGTGLAFASKQILLQGAAPFDETRQYNAGSVIGATRQPLFGNRPVRHIEGGGGLLNFFVGSLLSTIGFSTTRENNTSPIVGTATGQLPKYVQTKGGGRYGLMRGETASGGAANFSKVWAGTRPEARTSGFLSSIMRAVASTTGLFSNSGRPATWAYRPEYGHNIMETDPYISMMVVDNRKLLSYTGVLPLYGVATGKFYNDSRDPLNNASLAQSRQAGRDGQGSTLNTTVSPIQLAKSFPQGPRGEDFSYARTSIMQQRYSEDANYESGLTALYKRMFNLVGGQNDESQHPIYNKSAERYNTNTSKKINEDNNYNSIPNGATTITGVEKSSVSEGPYEKYLRQSGGVINDISIDNRLFSKASNKRSEFGTADEYNKYLPNIDNESDLALDSSPDQSKDIIFFYFYDLINKLYIPFRATLTSMADQHSPDWEEIKYMGRADKLYVYRGFGRDVTFNFRVYANSIDELIPMWERVNYLSGLVRPAKYTARALATGETPAGQDGETDTTGLESEFIYPPMIEFRIGDLYVDQPAIIRSLSISVPEDAHWETLRSDTYKYIYGVNKALTKESKSRQLPTIVDITVQLTLMEKEKSITKAYHFGPRTGWNNL